MNSLFKYFFCLLFWVLIIDFNSEEKSIKPDSSRGRNGYQSPIGRGGITPFPTVDGALYPLFPFLKRYEQKHGILPHEALCINEWYSQVWWHFKDNKDWVCTGRDCDIYAYRQGFKCCANYTRVKEIKAHTHELLNCVNDSTNREYKDGIQPRLDQLLDFMQTGCEPEFKFDDKMDDKCRELSGRTGNVVPAQEYCLNKSWTDFQIDVAFKYSQYIVLIGFLGKPVPGQPTVTPPPYPGIPPQGISKQGHQLALRVMPWHTIENSEQKDKYYDAKVWDDILFISRRDHLLFAFTTFNPDSMTILGQRFPEMVYFVDRRNRTVAYQFDPYKVVELQEKVETFSWERDRKIVYNPDKDLDRSGFFRLRYLYLHFPYPMTIENILMFRRTNRRRGDSFEDPIYYAIVYTDERVGGKTRLLRHFMRGKQHEYRDYKEWPLPTKDETRRKKREDPEPHEYYKEQTYNREGYYRSLDWEHDWTVDFCQEIERMPSAVVSTRTSYLNYMFPVGDKMTILHFIEIFDTKHKMMRLTFASLDSDDYFIGGENYGEETSNLNFLNCEANPILRRAIMDPPKVECSDDVPNESDSESLNSGSDESRLILFGIMATIVSIVILIVLSFVLFFKK